MDNGCIKSIYVDMWHQKICGRPVKSADGSYCGIHDPIKRQALQKKKQVQWDAEREANERVRVATERLITRLGMGVKQYGKEGWTGNVILTAEQIEEVLSWRDQDCDRAQQREIDNRIAQEIDESGRRENG